LVTFIFFGISIIKQENCVTHLPTWGFYLSKIFYYIFFACLPFLVPGGCSFEIPDCFAWKKKGAIFFSASGRGRSSCSASKSSSCARSLKGVLMASSSARSLKGVLMTSSCILAFSFFLAVLVLVLSLPISGESVAVSVSLGGVLRSWQFVSSSSLVSSLAGVSLDSVLCWGEGSLVDILREVLLPFVSPLGNSSTPSSESSVEPVAVCSSRGLSFSSSSSLCSSLVSSISWSLIVTSMLFLSCMGSLIGGDTWLALDGWLGRVGEASLEVDVGLSGGKEFRSWRFGRGVLAVISPVGVVTESGSGGPLLVAMLMSGCSVSLMFSWFGGSWMLAGFFCLAPVTVSLV
jgi:hypothetical protein